MCVASCEDTVRFLYERTQEVGIAPESFDKNSTTSTGFWLGMELKPSL